MPGTGNIVDIYRMRRAWLRATMALAIDALYRELSPEILGFRVVPQYRHCFTRGDAGSRLRQDTWNLPYEPAPVVIAAWERIGLATPGPLAPDYRDRPIQRIRISGQRNSQDITAPTAEIVADYLRRLRHPAQTAIPLEAEQWLNFHCHISLLWHVYYQLAREFPVQNRSTGISSCLPWLGRLVAVHHRLAGCDGRLSRCPLRLARDS